MTPKDWIIKSVTGMFDSQYGKRAKFFLEGYEHEVSCFTRQPEKIVPGASLFGFIEVKDGKWHNFKFGTGHAGNVEPRFNVGAAELKNYIAFEVIPRLDKILAWQDRRDVLDGIEKKKDPPGLNPDDIDRAFESGSPF